MSPSPGGGATRGGRGAQGGPLTAGLASAASPLHCTCLPACLPAASFYLSLVLPGIIPANGISNDALCDHSSDAVL
jgi:hypothetical protein